MYQRSCTRKKKDDNNEIPKERYTSPQERQQIINELRLIQQDHNGMPKNSKFDR